MVNEYKLSFTATQIDERLEMVGQLSETTGNLENLETTNKSSLVAAVNEVLGKAGTGGSGGNADGLSDTAKTLLVAILRNAVYSTDQSANITALKNALASGGNDAEPDNPDEPDVPVEPDEPESEITQDDTTLVIVSALTVTQNGTALTIG